MTNETVLSQLDWWLIAIVVFSPIIVGVLLKSRADDGGVEEFFTAGREMKWWMLGTSMVATTFAADTPLAITGWIAKYGVAGNWFWWGGAISTMAITVFFARRWRLSGVVTDAEIAELRYGGPIAMVLRTSKAAVNALILNTIVLGWLFAAMSKFTEPFMDWEHLFGSNAYGLFSAYYPSFLVFGTLDNTITVLMLLAITLIYSALGGLRAVLITDLVQFVLLMTMSITLSWLAVSHIGGLQEMWERLAELYPSEGAIVGPSDLQVLSHEQITAFSPSFGDGVVGSLGIPFSALLLTFGMLWWADNRVDGSGYIAQRLYTAKNAAEAEKGALWFAVANFIARTWPWVIAGIAALIIYPRIDVHMAAEEFTACLHDEAVCTLEMRTCLDNRYACTIKEYSLLRRERAEADGVSGGTSSSGNIIVFVEDRERGYPALIKDILPGALKGLAVASLMAAFMSTVSTHVNWGASYIANDFYLRFVNAKASNRQLTMVSRLSTVGIALLGAYVATYIDNLGVIWELFAAMVAGLGLPHVLRWFWWRANAWTEITGMLAALCLALTNFFIGQSGGYANDQISILPSAMATHPIHVICWIAIISGAICIVSTYLTKPVDDDILRAFAKKVQPIGFWKDYNQGDSSGRSLGQSVYYWLLGTASVYAGLFGIGFLLRLKYAVGLILLVFFVVTMIVLIRGLAATEKPRTAAPF